jgi:endonuclease III
MPESFEHKKKRALKILRRLKKEYPRADIALRFRTPMQLLCAVILSAQATDVHVNNVTEALFKKYKTVDDFAAAHVRTFTREVHSINFYRNKATAIVRAARMVRDEYGGTIPDDINELVTLPFVGRKTANIILWHVYHKAQGVVVDTHVKRVANKLGLTTYSDPVKIERDLMELYPKREWGMLGHYFQAYGRTASPARGKPKMEDPVQGLY